MKEREKIIILDFGSQYTQLIARKVRELGVYAEIFPYNTSKDILSESVKGLILSGGPSSVYEDEAPKTSFDFLNLDIPVLGICYGLQLICYNGNGKVDSSAKREYGKASLEIDDYSDLFKGLTNNQVWMSHGDSLTKMPDGFEKIAHSANSPFCAIRDKERKIYGIQFHPEVHHSTEGKVILGNFVRDICGCEDEWNASSFIEESLKKIKEQVGEDKVICALSGGVDSTVTAVLLHKAIGDNLYCVHVDSGTMRKNESKMIIDLFDEHFNMQVSLAEAQDLFLDRLKDVSDPEKKRKIIGNTFIDVFEKEAKKLNGIKWLAQGTLYPDVIESVSVKGPSATIKSHHNVGGLPDFMKLKVVEPLNSLFKDEVRRVGKELGLKEEILHRHPFPGPGLGIRILGEITEDRIKILQDVDYIFIDGLKSNGLYDEVWQALVVLLPVQSVGVMGDERTYENVVALRAVGSTDGMTADWSHLPYEFLGKVSSDIINKVKGVNRVVYDISSKPPATIEWE